MIDIVILMNFLHALYLENYNACKEAIKLQHWAKAAHYQSKMWAINEMALGFEITINQQKPWEIPEFLPDFDYGEKFRSK